MNSDDRQSRSKQPVQRLDRRQPRTAAPPATTNRCAPGGDVITYQDSMGRDLETDEGDYYDAWPQRVPNSAIRYLQPYQQGTTRYQVHPHHVQAIPPRRSAPQGNGGQRTTEDVAVTRPRRSGFRPHWSVFLGFGMLLMVLLFVGLSDLASWWRVHQDDLTYGRPRTAQYDVVVGHNDSPTHKTHLIALNLHSSVVIIEIPGGDTSKAHIYDGPHIVGQDADLDPVTLSFRDTTGDGKLDMIVTVQGDQTIYLNKNGQFVLQPSH